MALTYGAVQVEYAVDDDDPHDVMEYIPIHDCDKFIGHFERFGKLFEHDDDQWTEWMYLKEFVTGQASLFRDSGAYESEITKMLKALNAGKWMPGDDDD